MMFERTISFIWMLPKVTGKCSGYLNFTQTEAGAGDQDFFMENLIGHDRYNCV